MQEKRKKFWIIFSVVIAGIITVCAIFGIATNLRTVSVEFRQRIAGETRLEENILDKVRDDGEFEYGKGLLFNDINSSISKIEKKNPFVKVEQVIRKFPSTLSVYISERVPVSYVSDSQSYYVLDKEFKVLDKIQKTTQGDEYLAENYLTKIYKIETDFGTNVYETGDFVTISEELNQIKQVHSGIVGAQMSSTGIKSIKIENDNVYIVMKKDNTTFDDGVHIVLEGTDDLKIKTFVAIEFFEEKDKSISAGTIKVKKIDGEKNKYSAYIEN